MATMIDGESYLWSGDGAPVEQVGRRYHVSVAAALPESQVWRPTFGVDVNGVEIIRFDPHGARGHWHKGGYDKLGAGGSHVDYPEGMMESAAQMEFSLQVLREQTGDYLAEAGYPEAASNLDPELLQAASDAIVAHLHSEGDLVSEAQAKDLIAA